MRILHWEIPEINDKDLKPYFADSTLREFVLGHGSSATLVELVQNEYDAEGTKLEIIFSRDMVSVFGNGKVIDNQGWRRLKVLLGTGQVFGSDEFIHAKVNGIGSKNFGLRSLFNFGDRIFIASGGYQTVLDMNEGAPEKPFIDRASINRAGIHLHVPYRTKKRGDYIPFSVDREGQLLERYSKDLLPILIKIASVDSKKNLKDLYVSSERCQREIVWKQSVSKLPSQNRMVRVLKRNIIMSDIEESDVPQKRVEKLEEIEFQKSYKVPEEYRGQSIPSYFRVPGGHIKIALSIRLKKGKLDFNNTGIFYYPLGLQYQFTGTCINICAPFQLNEDRSRIIDPDDSTWNQWLLEQAADFTVELLTTDLIYRFGLVSYKSVLKLTQPTTNWYYDALIKNLMIIECWPTRLIGRRKHIFKKAKDIVIPHNDNLDGFLSKEQYLDVELDKINGIRDLVLEGGAKTFTLNSLVRLRCFGTDKEEMLTELNENEADYHYKGFPNELLDVGLQKRFATTLDLNRQNLSKPNLEDLTRTKTTLTADGSLEGPPFPLWVVDEAILDVCQVPKSQQLHSSLIITRVIPSICQKFDISKWVANILEKIARGNASKEEREALYHYTISVHGHLRRNLKSKLKALPVIKDHKNIWVSPKRIISKKTLLARRIQDVLHFPNKDYEKDDEIASSLKFKHQIDGSDLIEYAKRVEDDIGLAEAFEETLQKSGNILKRSVINQLKNIAFLQDSKGGLSNPRQVYIKNNLNIACLGEEALFPKGNKTSLYKKFGCRLKPVSDDIVEYILSLKNKPEKQEVIYTELVSALKREGKSLDYHEDELIIWNGKGYDTPSNTIINSRYRKYFINVLPCFSVSSRKLRDTLLSLGANIEPNKNHWLQLLTFMGTKYEEIGGPVTQRERHNLHRIYRELGSFPNELSDAKFLLDKRGYLHDMQSVNALSILINDNPRLADAIDAQKIPITFIDDLDYTSVRFYRSAKVKALTSIQKLIRITIGKEISPQKWINDEKRLGQLHSSDFASALVALREYELKNTMYINSYNQVEMSRRLRSIKNISFTEDITATYEVAGYNVPVKEKVAFKNTTIYMNRVNSRSELLDYLALVLASILVDDLDLQRKISVVIYRLLTCTQRNDIKQFLNRRGIPWNPQSSLVEEWEEYEEEDEELLDKKDADKVGNLIIDAIKNSVKMEGRATDNETRDKPSEKPSHSGTPETPEKRKLPPLENVVAVTIEPSDDWIPPTPRRGEWSGSSSWTPKDASDEEWQREVGRRGEELIYRHEMERVKALGYHESRVKWVAINDSAADFDILSVDDDGEDIWIEVKSTSGTDGRFQWPRAEFERAIDKRERYILWRVYEADSEKPRKKPFRDPVGRLIDKKIRLDINNFNAMIEPM